MRLITFITLLLFLFLTPFASALADSLYIKKSGTKIYSEPSAKSTTVETLKAGTEVESLKTEGKYHQIKTPSGKTGWVFKFKVSDQEPDDGSGGLLGALGGSDMSVKESTSSSSIRGLSPVSEEHAKKKGISEADIQAVKAMEDYKVSAGEVDQFLATRKLGEYQE